MSRIRKYLGLATLVAIVAALGISSAAMAQTSTTPTPTAPTAPAAPGMGRGGGGGGFNLRSQAALEAAAKVLGMTTDDLSAQLWGGKTLAEIAAAKKVDIATVKAAVETAMQAEQKAAEATRLTETKTAIQAAVTARTITQAKADWLLEGLDKGYWGAGQDGGIGFGMGKGPGGAGMERGGRGMRGGFGAPPSDDDGTTTPNSTTTTPSRFAF
jgi:hypothetical protein